MSETTGRLTIADIARRAGVSASAVSLALNGRPGVSTATRERIAAIARELDLRPNPSARALVGGAAGSVGLVVARPARTLGTESFFGDLIAGIQVGLADSRTGMLLLVAPDHRAELDTYREWWSGRRVDGVIVIDPEADDPRLALLEDLGLPAAVLGASAPSGGAPSVWIDDAAAARSVFGYLRALGHRRVAHVTGRAAFEHTVIRRAVLQEAARDGRFAEAESFPTDYSEEASERLTRELLSRPDRPTALVYDNDVQAITGLGVAAEMGIAVPEALSVASFDDSVLARFVRPSLTALVRDTVGLGEQVARLLLAEIAAPGQPSERGPDPVLVPRGSTAPPA